MDDRTQAFELMRQIRSISKRFSRFQEKHMGNPNGLPEWLGRRIFRNMDLEDYEYQRILSTLKQA